MYLYIPHISLSSHGGLQLLLKGNQINIIQITNLQPSFYKSNQIKCCTSCILFQIIHSCLNQIVQPINFSAKTEFSLFQVKWQAGLFDIIHSSKFETFIMILICLNMLVMMIQHHEQRPEVDLIMNILLFFLFVKKLLLPANMTTQRRQWIFF